MLPWDPLRGAAAEERSGLPGREASIEALLHSGVQDRNSFGMLLLDDGVHELPGLEPEAPRLDFHMVV